MRQVTRHIHTSPHHSAAHLLVLTSLVWSMLGCLVMESGGPELEQTPDRPAERPTGPVDELDGFDDLDPTRPGADMSPAMPDQDTPEPDQDTPEPDQDTPEPTPGLVVEGEVVGDAPERGQVVAIWHVADAVPQYFYKLGQGESAGSRYTLEISPEAPPAEALNNGALGVAFLLGIKDEEALPGDGVLTREAFRALSQRAFGVSTRHGVVYVSEGGAGSVPRGWTDSFARGMYVCAEGRDDGMGLQPFFCDEIDVAVTSSLSWITW